MSPIPFSQVSYHPEFDSCKHHISDEGSTISVQVSHVLARGTSFEYKLSLTMNPSQTNAKTDWWRNDHAWRSTGPLLGLVLEKGKTEWTAEVEMGGDWRDEVCLMS